MPATSPVHVRLLEPRDGQEWIAQRVALWPDQTEPDFRSHAMRFLSEEHRLGTMPEAVWVAVASSPEGAERIVGFAEVSRRLYAEGCSTSPVGFLEGWYVKPEFRHRGVGGALVAAGETWARSLGCREFASDALVDNDVSTAAHKALGFAEVEVIRCFRKDLA